MEFIIGLLFITLFSYAFLIRRKDNVKKARALAEFNQNRTIPLNSEQYDPIFRFENSSFPILGMILKPDLNKTNHRNGDKLILNPKLESIIKEHIPILKTKANKTVIISLGYNFENHKNFLIFVKALASQIKANQTFVFPINKHWFVIQRNFKGIAVSYRTDSFEKK